MKFAAHLKVLDRITVERGRQDKLKAAGRFAYTCADAGLTEAEKLAVLTEEVGEVAREVLSGDELVSDGGGTVAALREELVQVAAISAAWLEGLEGME